MRWCVGLVVLAILAGVAGCGTTRGSVDSSIDSAPLLSLSDSERQFAASLAHYCHGIMGLYSTEGQAGTLGDLLKAVDLDPENASQYLRVVRTMLTLSRYTDALRLLDRISDASPTVASVHAEAGFLRQLCGDFEGAEKEYETATRLAPAEPAGYSGLFHIAVLRNDLDRAQELLKRATRHVSDNGLILDCYKRMAYAFMKNDRFAEATDYLEYVNKNEPGNLSVILALFKNYILLDRRKEAVALLVSIAESIPDNLLLQYSIAEILLPAGYNKEAVDAFQRAAKLMTDVPDQELEFPLSVFYYHYGIASERQHMYEEAAELFLKSIDLDSTSHEVRNYLAYMWAEQNTNLDQALAQVREALKSEPDNGAYVDTLGWIYFKQQQYEEALVEIERAISLLPDDPTVTDHLGDVFMALKRPDEALKCWQSSFLLDPDNESVEQKLRSRKVNIEELRSRAEALKAKLNENATDTTPVENDTDSD
ncbi:MAG: tetratricopeptide repeat protein [Lentisphaerales bacterium]|jgi:tetratricopeptide (TPR) repeat protein|nr:MAG: tetratricopeptide repeat protein [Lentisphaerales bacterium]